MVVDHHEQAFGAAIEDRLLAAVAYTEAGHNAGSVQHGSGPLAVQPSRGCPANPRPD